MTDATEVERAGTWAKLRDRKVVQWGLVYVAAAWGFLQGLAYVSDSFHWSEQLRQIALLALLIGLPIVLVLAWYHGDRGRQRVSGTELAVLALLFLAGGFIFWRYQQATETAIVRTPPAAATTAEALVDDKSVAVLPFVNMSSDKEQEYFADGISEELLNLLTQIPELRVIARTSSFSFKGKEMDIAEIARRLNVAHVLEGSVRRSGDTLRITAQLIRASDSSRVWSETYERQMTDVFKVQDEIAAAVVSGLRVKLIGTAPKAKKVDPKAYALFLQARAIGRQYTSTGFEQSNDLYRQSLALDPSYAATWDGLASNYSDQAFMGIRPVDEAVQLTREATNRALTLDPAYPRGLLRRSWIASAYDLNLSAAARYLEEALALEPANPDVLAEAGYLLRRLGRLDQAIAIGQYQVALDPVNPYGQEIMAYTYRVAGRLDDAIAALRTVLSLSPNYLAAHEGIGELLLQKGDPSGALVEMQQEGFDSERVFGLCVTYFALGKKVESDAALAELIEKYGKVGSFRIASAYAFRGEADRAFEWLERAVRSHDLFLSATQIHPMLANLHSDPRWLPFLRKLGLAPEQLAAVKFDVKLPE